MTYFQSPSQRRSIQNPTRDNTCSHSCISHSSLISNSRCIAGSSVLSARSANVFPALSLCATPSDAASRSGQPAHSGRRAASIPPVVYLVFLTTTFSTLKIASLHGDFYPPIEPSYKFKLLTLMVELS